MVYGSSGSASYIQWPSAARIYVRHMRLRKQDLRSGPIPFMMLMGSSIVQDPNFQVGYSPNYVECRVPDTTRKEEFLVARCV